MFSGKMFSKLRRPPPGTFPNSGQHKILASDNDFKNRYQT